MATPYKNTVEENTANSPLAFLALIWNKLVLGISSAVNNILGSGASGASDYTAKSGGANADATSAYTSATTITITDLPFAFTKYDIKSIEQIPTSGDSTIFDKVTDFSVTGDVITVADATFAATDTFTVIISGQIKGYDSTLQSYLVNVQNPDYSRYTDKVSWVTNADIGATDDTWIDQGAEISGNGYKSVVAWVVLTVNNSTGNQIKFLGKHTSAGSDEYELLDTIKFEATLGDSDRKVIVPYNCTGIPYIQIQTKATVVGATEGTVTIDITKEY